MASENTKREALLKAYPSPKWWAKVRIMSDAQVVAVYLNLKQQGKV